MPYLKKTFTFFSYNDFLCAMSITRSLAQPCVHYQMCSCDLWALCSLPLATQAFNIPCWCHPGCSCLSEFCDGYRVSCVCVSRTNVWVSDVQASFILWWRSEASALSQVILGGQCHWSVTGGLWWWWYGRYLSRSAQFTTTLGPGHSRLEFKVRNSFVVTFSVCSWVAMWLM